MSKGYLFDTIACSRWRRGDPILKSKVRALPSDAVLYTSVISVGELVFGIQKAPPEYREKLLQRTKQMLSRFRGILEVTNEVANKYGYIVAQVLLRQHIGQNDYWISAIALTHDRVLISSDPDFDRVPELQKENWLSPSPFPL